MAAAQPWARGALAAAALAAAAAGQDATPTPPSVRYTWGKCRCKASWQEGGRKCTEGCCRFEDDGRGGEYYLPNYYYSDEYCYVEDPECEDSEWGFCRPETVSTCADYPPDWTDADGDDCYEYEVNGFCTASGGFGAAWDEGWGTFQSNMMGGFDAPAACCACGGGSRTFHQVSNDSRCADTEDWADADGDNCTTYAEYSYCTPDGQPGTGWREEYGNLSSFQVNGLSALEACCACGGGVDGTVTATRQMSRPDDEAAGVVVPSGVAWAVVSGPCTKDSSDCIRSPNYPEPYGTDERCVIGVNADRISHVTADPFSTEWGFDTLTVSGHDYSGTWGPDFLWTSGAIVWSSDHDVTSKGWRLCPEGPTAELRERRAGSRIRWAWPSSSAQLEAVACACRANCERGYTAGRRGDPRRGLGGLDCSPLDTHV